MKHFAIAAVFVTSSLIGSEVASTPSSSISPQRSIPEVLTAVSGFSHRSDALAYPSLALQARSIPLAEVKLLTPGVSDRQLLRLKPTVGTTQRAVMTMDLNQVITMQGAALPQVSAPSTAITIEMTVERVDPNGDVHYTFRYLELTAIAKPKTPPGLVMATQQALDQLKGIEGKVVSDDQGRTKSAQVTFSERMAPAVKEQFQQLFANIQQFDAPLPTEPVAPGAQWQVRQNLTVNGMRLNQTATYELIEIQDRVLTVRVQLQQTAPAQNVPLPNLPAGIVVSLKKMTAQGRGTSQFDLSQPFVLQSQVAVNQQMQMSTTIPQTKETIEVEALTQIEMKFAPK